MQGKVILVSASSYEVRVAVLDDNNISEIFIERARKKSVVGNIYKGKVVKILPGMQSAFVDVGLPKAAFLHVADLVFDNSPFIAEFMESDINVAPEINSDNENAAEAANTSNIPPIEELLTEGMEIVVQVAKDPTGNKGARLTSHLSIPGRYLVLMPNCDHMGVSRKIEEADEREKLRDILKEIRTDKGGLIARTVSKGCGYEELTADRDYLLRVLEKIETSIPAATAPELIYEDHDLVYRLLRDIVSEDTSAIIVDCDKEYEKMLQFRSHFLPNLDINIELYEKEPPLFELYNIEIEINRLLDKKIWLRSGGYIIIDQAEALTVIDVNTGKYVGKRNFEETILKTNLEAAKEIAHQLKLRNIGGIIIVDFIDMEILENRQKVLDLLDTLLKQDRARTCVANITPLGLVEITRKRTQESTVKIISEPCPYCEGRGTVKSRLSVCYDILRNLRRTAKENSGKRLVLDAHNEVSDILLSNEREWLDAIEKEFNVTIEIKFRNLFHVEHYELVPMEKLT